MKNNKNIVIEKRIICSRWVGYNTGLSGRITDLVNRVLNTIRYLQTDKGIVLLSIKQPMKRSVGVNLVDKNTS